MKRALHTDRALATSLPAHRSRQQRPLVHALRLVLLGTALGAATAHATPGVIPLAGLDGRNGFRIDEFGRQFEAQFVSAAGDINGDGIHDLVIGLPSDNVFAGRTCVVFGRTSGFPASFSLTLLDGSNGFCLEGVSERDDSGIAVSDAGDINGDGIDDLIIGATRADPNGVESAGSSYVLFGRTTGFTANIALSALDGSTGFRLDGIAADERSGGSVSAAGDVNGDGIGDVIIGANGSDTNGTDSGSSYVVFGNTTGFPAVFPMNTLNGATGFRLDGAASDASGRSVASAGDVNGDGIDDLIIGAPNASAASGRSYVLFGRAAGGFASLIQLSSLDGSNGFRLDGVAAGDVSGVSVACAGDVNGDAIDDLIIGALGASPNGVASGSSYVVFGTDAVFPASIPLSSLDGNNGFRLDGIAANDQSGRSVSTTGDLNGDGIDDLIVGAHQASPEGSGNAGSSYVVYGRRTGFPSIIPLSGLDGSSGFRLDGAMFADFSGRSVSSAGDVNSDGLDDLIIGAPFARPIGSSYVVYGARDRIFGDGAEAVNIDLRYPRFAVRNSFIGSAVRWQNGATCNCDFAPFDLNLYNTGGNLALFWPVAGMNGGVASGTVYSVLQPGAVVGPSSTFSTDAGTAATVNWRNGADGYLGFRFVNADTGLVNYGYARIRTTAPTGYPVELIDFGVNLTGQAVTIPAQ